MCSKWSSASATGWRSSTKASWCRKDRWRNCADRRRPWKTPSFAPWAWAPCARRSTGCEHAVNPARAILWAQWRSLRNFFPRRGVGLAAFVGLIWYGFWIAAAFAVMLLTSSTMSTSLSGVFLLVVLYWQVVPVLMA